MASKRDYYEVLGVSKNATQDELKKAYRKLSMAYHPDRQAGKSDAEKKIAENKFKEVSEAYSVLNDKDKRAQYDQFGFDGPQAGGFTSGFDPFEMFRQHFQGFAGDDDFGGFPFGFGGFHQHHSQSSSGPDIDAPENGDDLQMAMQITFKESLHGCIKDINLDLDEPCPECNGRGVAKGSTPEKCSTCHGTGQVVHTQRNGFMVSQTITPCQTCHGQGIVAKSCPKCHGAKRLKKSKNISIKVPMGISDGQRLRVAGKGECGLKGGKDGDMYINVHVASSIWSRNGMNLIAPMPIDAVIASLGGKINVPTPWGIIDVVVPKCTMTGDKTTIKGYGVKTNSQKGDLIVKFIVTPLTNLNSEQKKLLDSLKKTLNTNNTPGLAQHLQSLANDA